MDAFLVFVEGSDLSMWIRGELHASVSDHHHVACDLHGTSCTRERRHRHTHPRYGARRGCADAHQAHRWHVTRNVGGRTYLRPDARVVRPPFFTDQPDALPAM